MGEVKLTQLRYFVAVAEELNFRRLTAERCRAALPGGPGSAARPQPPRSGHPPLRISMRSCYRSYRSR